MVLLVYVAERAIQLPVVAIMSVKSVTIENLNVNYTTNHKCRESSDSAHHRKSGFDSTWIHEYKWLEYFEKDGRPDRLGKLWEGTQEMEKGWTSIPCFTLRKDKIKKHAVTCTEGQL